MDYILHDSIMCIRDFKTMWLNQTCNIVLYEFVCEYKYVGIYVKYLHT